MCTSCCCAAGLLPKTTYFYQVGDPRFYYGLSPILNFTTLDITPPSAAEPSGAFKLPFR